MRINVASLAHFWRRAAASSWLAALVMFVFTGITQAAETRWKEGYIPNVPVVTQDGRTLLFYDDVMKGRISIISFIYTSCRDICPVVTARLSQLEDNLGDSAGRDYFFVSISIDPLNDTPDKLKEYSKAFGIGSRWLFLTGKAQDIELIRHRLGERSRALTEHRNEVLLFNDVTGEWERNSAFGDINVLASAVRAMDPVQRAALRPTEQANAGTFVDDPLNLPGQALFLKTCGGCHTIGRGNRVGPDLQGISTRRSRDWLTAYIMKPEKMRASKDPAALALAQKYPEVRMPNLGLSEFDSSDVIAYIEAMTYARRADESTPHAHHHHH
ncbi:MULTISPECIES: SCO family protein [Bradyrhizobium]|uniref:SCO family protein n=1 Tax=Bradyrhizobium TaxID=374 RepID=UPI001B89EAC5|nr:MULTISPECIES: SCO family protein [Bradyrhizobium]MBR0975131.1 SCO family protein [Bradyrhizobium japonicum]